MRPSPQDRQIHRQLQGIIGIGMTGESVIIDVTSGRYCTFDDAESEAHTRDDGRRAAGATREYGALRQDRTRRTTEGKDVASLPVIRGSADVASLVAEKRLGGGEKISYLLVAHNGAVIGNLHTAYGSYGEDLEGLADEMVRMGVRHGAETVMCIILRRGEIIGNRWLSIRCTKRKKKLIVPTGLL